MIEVKNLKKIYNGNAVLKDVNAVIEKGEVISIIGPSGTGKSTFLRCLNLLEQPDGGEIWIDGKNILDKKTDITAIRRKMGMVFQSFNLFGHLTVLENIAMRNRQRQWLLELQQTDLWKETIFHVAVTHMTAYNEKYGSRELIRMLDGVFDFSPEKRLHALIGGHLHFYYAQMPGEMEFLLDMQWSDNHTAEVAVTRPPQAFPYFVMCIPAVCGLNADVRKSALLSLHATAESLELKLFSIDGKVKHAFEIDPAGKCLKRMIE